MRKKSMPATDQALEFFKANLEKGTWTHGQRLPSVTRFEQVGNQGFENSNKPRLNHR